MKTTLLIVSAVFLLTACNVNQSAVKPELPPATSQSSIRYEDALGQEYRVDTAQSTVQWSGSKIVGEPLTGTIDIQSGGIKVDQDQLNKGRIIIDMTTIQSTNLSGESAKKLTEHLSNADFFDVPNHPTATLDINSATPIPDATDGQPNYRIAADLTIKGNTRPIEFPATIAQTENGITGTAKFSIDRTLWDIHYGSASIFSDLGDNAIKDDIEFIVTINSIANKQS